MNRLMIMVLGAAALMLTGCSSQYHSDRVRAGLESGRIAKGMAFDEVVEVVGRGPRFPEVTIIDTRVYWQVVDGGSTYDHQSFSVNGERVTVSRVDGSIPPPAPWLMFASDKLRLTYPREFSPMFDENTVGLRLDIPDGEDFDEVVAAALRGD